MSRFNQIAFAAVVAVLAVAATAASASAHEYFVNGGKLGAGVKEALATNVEEEQTQEFLGTPFGVATHINCSKLETTGEIEGTNKGSARFEFTKCTVTKPANCAVKEPIETRGTTELVGPSPGVEVEVKPSVGEAFSTLTLEGASCALKEPFNVTGTQSCKLPTAETEAITHEIKCETTGSNLKAGGKAATFKGGAKALGLKSGNKWSSN
jgi:hypothetical protein